MELLRSIIVADCMFLLILLMNLLLLLLVLALTLSAVQSIMLLPLHKIVLRSEDDKERELLLKKVKLLNTNKSITILIGGRTEADILLHTR